MVDKMLFNDPEKFSKFRKANRQNVLFHNFTRSIDARQLGQVSHAVSQKAYEGKVR